MKNRFSAGALTYLIGNAANAAIPFLLMPLLTRALSPADYGAVAMFTLFVIIAGAVTGLSMHGAIGVRFFQLDAGSFARYVGSCLRVLAMSTAIALLLVALGGSWLELRMELPTGWLLVATLAASANVIIMIRLSLWQMQQQPGRFVMFQVGQSLLNMFLSVLLVLGLSMNWQGRALGHIVTTMAFATLALWWLRGGQLARPAGWQDTRDILRFGVPLIPHVLGGLAITMVDRLMIANMLDVAQAGIYTVALQIGMGMGLLTESFNRVYAPWLMSSLSQPDRTRDVRIVRGTYCYFVFVAVLAAALGLAAPWLLSIFVGEAFQGAAAPIFYIAMGFAFGGMYYMVTNYVFYASRTAHLAAITLTCGAFNVAITWYLIRVSGIVGAAQGFMLSQAALFLGTWLLAQRVHPMPWLKALFGQKNTFKLGLTE
jgi:O-antigen/teichoic acid export membrane protein